MDLVDVLVNAHSTLDSTEEVLKSTKEEVMSALNSLENSIISEDNRDTGHLTNIYETLQPVLQKYAALRELHESLTALKEKVPRNDATTNGLRINASTVKKMITQKSYC
ncbi:hypothetical protein OESDEN_06170 [Oesophagostomum dentatum]|uniref:Uncharacterized protein n=1 Tax=Oesophagostomum dentatum TaxID=61180 RepID=A0A0B1T9I5_OESDE|nr:hypothetical protein OESDEN_06170 [Oesophagostomum dentatum]